MSRPFIVFGYGSLIVKPPDHVIKQVPGFLKGFVRRFAQKSHDHRGTPDNPGRVVTLIHKEDWDKFSQSDAFPHEDVVWGIAYTIDPVHEARVRYLLDVREKDGYTMESLDVHGVDSDGAEVIIVKDGSENFVLSDESLNELFSRRHLCCYVGRNGNPSFVASESLHDIARTILRSAGQSGPNKDYLYKLAESIRQLSVDSFDSHLFALEKMVRGLDDTASIAVSNRQVRVNVQEDWLEENTHPP